MHDPRVLRAALYASLLTASCALKLSAVDAGVASVAKLRPTDNKDAFFTAAPRFYGVFDGVSQCPESRIYAQTLAKETSAALKRSGDAGGSWSDQAQAALQQAAQAADRYSGSSTAIMMRLDLDQPQPQVCTFALGDSSALVLRYQPDGSYAVGDTSGVMYHDNGAPYQLGGKEWKSDVVGDGLVEAFDVGAGDYILCFSDGVSGNLALNEIARLVSACEGQSAEVVARTIVAAAQNAKIIADDVTAVAVRVGEGGWVGGATDSDAASGGAAGLVESKVQVRLQKPLGIVLEELQSGGAGVEVGELLEGGAAFESGEIKEGDVLMRVGRADVSKLDFDQVMEKLQAADDVVELTFARTDYADADNSWLEQIKAKAAAMPVSAPAAAPQSSDPANQAADALKGALGGLFGKAKAAAAAAAADAAEAAKVAAQKKFDEMKDKK